MTSPAAPHAFEDSGERRLDVIGRTLKICAVCGGSNRGRRHPPGPPRDRSHPGAPLRLPGREILELALALDAVLEISEELIDWRLRHRALAVRELMRDIPRSVAVSMPASPPGRARSGGAGGAQSTPAASLPIEPFRAPAPRLIEHVARSTRSRARALSKAIADPQFREIAARAIADGWSLARTGSGHWQLARGPGERLTFAQTPSDHRAYLNTRARARRAGIDTEGL